MGRFLVFGRFVPCPMDYGSIFRGKEAFM